jgi:pilus assembly protein CpaE
MARLTASIVSDDAAFKAQLGDLLRFGPVAASVLDDVAARAGQGADVVIVDGRDDAASSMRAIERMRAASTNVSIFLIADTAAPELILQSMRAGANEFFAWPLQDAALSEALTRAAARAQTVSGRPQASLMVFIGAKGGVGTTTLAVNTAVDLARLGGRPSLIIDLKPGLGEVALFLGMRCRYTLFDALENLHRLDGDFLRELLARHKSGLDVLSGSEQFDRPGEHDGPAIEEVVRLLSRQYAHIVIDAGTQLTASSIATLYAADAICLVGNPDVASVRNAQRLLDRLRQLGPCGERVRVLMNRAAEPYLIPPAQIETALGHPIHQMFPSDYRTVAAALNSGVPLTQAGNSELAQQFEKFTRQFLGEAAPADTAAAAKRSTLGIQRLASLW